MGAIEELDSQIDECKKVIDTSEALEKLMKNKFFKELFLDYYLRDQALELIQQKTNSELQSPEEQTKLNDQIMAISYFSRYLDNIQEMGVISTQQLANAEHEKNMYLREENE
jgi:hypothetical protein